MDKKIIDKLVRLSEEEKQILLGQKDIRKDDYTLSDKFIVNSKKLLSGNKQIDLRLHTRFIDFPEHGHDYMEFMYVYAGHVAHEIGGKRIDLQSGDILFLNRHIRHSVLRAEKDDIGINFILSDSFLKYIFHNVQNNPIISAFLTRNFDEAGEGEYLHFRTKDTFPIRNLMDNLIFALAQNTAADYTILTQIVSLLFSYLSYYKETLANNITISSPQVLFKQYVSAYVTQQYPRARLAELADALGYPSVYLSRRIAHVFGKTFRELVIEERLRVAERLLLTTRLSVDEIIRTVGYENQTHFHHMFKEKFGETPYRYRQDHTSYPLTGIDEASTEN